MTIGRVIIVDWGTTSFRAWLVDEVRGAVLEEIPDGQGMRGLKREDFAAYCTDRLAPWRIGDAPPVYLCGMVGAAQGWHTAPQPPLPVGADDLANQIVAAPGMANAYIIPGTHQPAPAIDVMRGEEVQIFGALEQTGLRDALLCLPGTHSKWVRVENARLTAFTTSMTGEVYEVMLAHSVLGLTADKKAPFAPAAFDAGLEQAAQPGGLLHHLFTARSRGLYALLPPAETESYLSGLLIGTEIAAMRGLYPQPSDQPVLLVCTPALRTAYERAFQHAGLSCRWVAGRDATIRGVRLIAACHRVSSSSEMSS